MPDDFSELRDIVARLRKECPWDREQTLESLKNNIVEEATELREAIEKQDYKNLQEEIGDVILVALMLAEIAKETQDVSVDEALRHVIAKMKRRHPHVFGDAKAETADDALRLFHEAKAKEKQS